MTGLPWKLTVSSTTAGKVDGVGFKISPLPVAPPSRFLEQRHHPQRQQSVAGNCKINSLSVKPTPAFVVNP
ncbi:hypothetical protein BANRA_00010 [Pseudomonas aeruginosa]|nr:hypothetical protein BANRA_00010 [Pseudomonas aeruginosa]